MPKFQVKMTLDVQEPGPSIEAHITALKEYFELVVYRQAGNASAFLDIVAEGDVEVTHIPETEAEVGEKEAEPEIVETEQN